MRVYVEFNEGCPQLYALAIFLPTVLLTSLLVRLPSMIWSLTAYTYLIRTPIVQILLNGSRLGLYRYQTLPGCMKPAYRILRTLQERHQ